jgi:periplasmic divalent cation tolerance protein
VLRPRSTACYLWFELMPQPDYVAVLITVGSAEEAQKIADALLKRRQAACVNIVPEVDSHFWWQGRLDSAIESLLIVKTKKARLPDVIKSVKKLHSYEVPEIIALPVVGGNKDYLDWLDREVKHVD